MENSIISNFINELFFWKFKIICFVNVETNPRLWYYKCLSVASANIKTRTCDVSSSCYVPYYIASNLEISQINKCTYSWCSVLESYQCHILDIQNCWTRTYVDPSPHHHEFTTMDSVTIEQCLPRRHIWFEMHCLDRILSLVQMTSTVEQSKSTMQVQSSGVGDIS
jgi:hypothetical protein